MNKKIPHSLYFLKIYKAFTLIEMLVVIAIISILAALIFSMVKSSMQSSQSAKCIANLKQLGIEINIYAAENGVYPKSPSPPPIWVNVAYMSSNWLCPSRFIKKDANTGNSFTPAYTPNSLIFTINTDVRPASISRPSEIIALIDCDQRSPSGWAIPLLSVSGSSSAATANQPITGSPITTPDVDICQGPAGVRYRHQGKANALFLDGHVQFFTKGTILQKNYYTNY
jgi:prepilin-type N-terminal cleavage/methylation domain-containing protein/prepilin-type processing-associated H-X9-DG protein